MLSVLTETPGTTAPMHANILPPTFHASWPPPQGSDTSAPGNARQMAFTISRLIGSFFPSYNPVHSRATSPGSAMCCFPLRPPQCHATVRLERRSRRAGMHPIQKLMNDLVARAVVEFFLKH